MLELARDGNDDDDEREESARLKYKLEDIRLDVIP